MREVIVEIQRVLNWSAHHAEDGQYAAALERLDEARHLVESLAHEQMVDRLDRQVREGMSMTLPLGRA